MRRVVFMLAVLHSFSLQGLSQETASPRNLFMSPAGSKIEYREDDKKEKDITKVQQKEKTNKSTAIETTRKEYLGMEVQVLIPAGIGLRPIDYKRHVFKTGDRFKVQIFYNSPGIVEFENENPEGKVSYLGRWIVESAFSGSLLPRDGWFSFDAKKGRERLIIYFYPCQPYDKKLVEETKTAYSRDIAFVKDKNIDEQVTIKENIYSSLPLCDFSEKKRSRDEYVSMSRDIVYKEEKTTKAFYYLAPYERYKEDKKPIIAILEFTHR